VLLIFRKWEKVDFPLIHARRAIDLAEAETTALCNSASSCESSDRRNLFRPDATTLPLCGLVRDLRGESAFEDFCDSVGMKQYYFCIGINASSIKTAPLRIQFSEITPSALPAPSAPR
jgi:hypothetical protein